MRATKEDIQKFLGLGKQMSIKNKSRYTMEIIAQPWKEVAKAIMRLFIIEGYYNDVYG